MNIHLPDNNFVKKVVNLISEKINDVLEIIKQDETESYLTCSLSNGLNIIFYYDTQYHFAIFKQNVKNYYPHNSLFYISLPKLDIDDIKKELTYLGKFVFVEYLKNKILITGTINDILEYCDNNNITYQSWNNNPTDLIFSYTFYHEIEQVGSYRILPYSDKFLTTL